MSADFDSVFDRFRPFAGEDVQLKIPGEGDSEVIRVFSWSGLDEEEQATIWEYHLDESFSDRVDAGDLIPFAIVGLTGDADSFEEMGARGALLFDLEAGDDDECPVLAYFGDEDDELRPFGESGDLSIR